MPSGSYPKCIDGEIDAINNSFGEYSQAHLFMHFNYCFAHKIENIYDLIL